MKPASRPFADAHFLKTLDQVPYFSEAEYRHDPALFTLECSRPAIGPYSVMANLNEIGLRGYQVLLASSLAMAVFTKKEIAKIDARLSFTTSIGYSLHGINITAWKAVFFNPKTDRAVVEQVIRSIEDL
ncbi:MAG: hypothetical protein QNK24_05485 [Desulfuromusa sp.]|nr:hypothetical protein [Desulfuromusa sp.]